LSILLLLAACLPAFAKEAAPAADDPILEQRTMKLASELRCLVCQNQSLADSHADLAIDLKNQVRSQIREGRSDAEIRQYMVARYGDFVLYSPPWKATTVALWAGPFVLLVLGAAALAIVLRSRRARIADRELTPEERARAQSLLRREGDPE